jgi:hypothetical protein
MLLPKGDGANWIPRIGVGTLAAFAGVDVLESSLFAGGVLFNVPVVMLSELLTLERSIIGDLNGFLSAALATSTRRRLAVGPGVCDDMFEMTDQPHFLEPGLAE